MGLILDTSILIADERGKFDKVGFLHQYPSPRLSFPQLPPLNCCMALSAHQTLPALPAGNTTWSRCWPTFFVQPFDLDQARCPARLWADLEMRGQMTGAHDLQIAAAAVALGHDLATLNLREFQRVTSLRLVDASEFWRP